jgi:cytochrome c5
MIGKAHKPGLSAVRNPARLACALALLAFPLALQQALGQQSGARTTRPAERSGEQIVNAQCAKCHQAGVGGAPRIGNREEWIPRMKQGLDVVVRSAIAGHGGMPARGGMANLTDPEMRNAIIYMFNPGRGAAK